MAESTGYCTKDDVQRLVKRVTFDDKSKVTPSDIAEWIDSVSAQVDGEMLKLGVTLPVPETAKQSCKVLKMLVAYEVASIAEQAANFGTNKNSSSHGEWLHKQYLERLEQIQTNPTMLSDLVTASVRHMKSDTEDMNEGESKEGDEIFTKKHIDDFRDNNKILSPSEKSSTTESITGEIPRDRI